jgi:hypothetical protein
MQRYDVLMIRSPRHSLHLARLTSLGLLLAFGCLAVAGSGCQRALFPEKDPRTQFETYDLMRQRYVPLEAPDVFGEPKPALRARLGSN